MKLACLRRRPRPQNVANPSPMLTFTGTVMCKGVPDSSAKVSFGRRVILSSMFANQFPNRRGQFSFNIRKNQCRIGCKLLLSTFRAKTSSMFSSN
uniref:Uncharacterized protein n=1 Tax=Strongyloides papillosus TaxID=174720 RepID=A0A0N5CCI3_STREA